LTSVNIPNSVVAIGGNAFRNCTSLKSIEIPNSVQYLGSYAFYKCSNLENVTIGSGIIDIGNQSSVTIDGTSISLGSDGKTFALCQNLMEVKCLAENVPWTNANTFDESMIEYATLYVAHSINSYRNTEPWSGFGNIVSYTPVYKLTYLVDNEVYKVTEYEEGESITPEADPTKEGYYFSGWSDIPETMPDHDVTVTGSFWLTPRCATPTITLIGNGKIKVESATEGATCVTNITASNAEPLTGGEISLTTPLVVYTITAYATREGYDNSDIATATFRWEKPEGDVNGDGTVNIADVTQLINMILVQ
jgi:hypothetical protein